MFRIKICGVTREADAVAAVDAGADAIGLNFYEKSPRSVTVDPAAAIAAAVGSRALRVGVFVNAPAEAIAELVERTPLDAIQLHGDEPVEFLAGLPTATPVIRAARVGGGGLGPIAEQLRAAERIGRQYQAVLLDAAGAAGEYGGTGRVADWRRIAEERTRLGATPLILAGGLNPDSVAEAIDVVRPDGVDTASGVESSLGTKDPGLVRVFVSAAHSALPERSDRG